MLNIGSLGKLSRGIWRKMKQQMAWNAQTGFISLRPSDRLLILAPGEELLLSEPQGKVRPSSGGVAACPPAPVPSSADFSAVSLDAEAAVQLYPGNLPHHGEGEGDVLGSG